MENSFHVMSHEELANVEGGLLFGLVVVGGVAIAGTFLFIAFYVIFCRRLKCLLFSCKYIFYSKFSFFVFQTTPVWG